MTRQCRQMTAMCHPHKMTVEEFFEEVINCQDSFVKNMNMLDKKPQWAEDWIQIFAAWAEMEKGSDDLLDHIRDKI